MGSITLGAKPDRLTVYVTPGDGWTAQLVISGGDWVAPVELAIGTAVWTAAIDGPNATFTEPPASTIGLTSSTPAKLRVGGETWAKGEVITS